MKITVVGGGNIGTAMCAEFASHGHEVSLLTSKPERFDSVLSVLNADEDRIYSGVLQKVSDRAQDVLPDAQVVVVTLPAFLMPDFASNSLEYIAPGTILVAMPGYGGVEFIFQKHVQKGVILVGFQRVPAVYRLIEYGRISKLSGRRAELLYAAMPNSASESVHTILEDVFSMPCRRLPNFLSVTLTPSNPILHTTRLYALFHTLSPDATLGENPCFYSDWDDISSDWLICCDAELQQLLTHLPQLDLRSVRSLKEHYESADVPSMTRKLRSIASLGGIRSPMVEVDGRFAVDWKSRYFQADFPYGLAIIKGIAVLCGMDTPSIDTVLMWYANAVGAEYYLPDGSFAGKDLCKTGIPQNYGIDSVDGLVKLYL